MSIEIIIVTYFLALKYLKKELKCASGKNMTVVLHDMSKRTLSVCCCYLLSDPGNWFTCLAYGDSCHSQSTVRI